MQTEIFDVVVIGSGPAGHSGALQAARMGRSVLIVERDRGVGGACVRRGTIPSKTLRETAVYFAGLRLRSCGVIDVDLPPHLQLASLMSRMESVITAHSALMSGQLVDSGVTQWHGRARFVDTHHVDVLDVHGNSRRVRGETILIATGSRPRTPPNVPVDHEFILDSDSVLSMMYVPDTMAILGAGVIASEYASIFASLGVKVTMIDRGDRPMSFLDPELSAGFVGHFEGYDGCRYLGESGLLDVAWDGVSAVEIELDSGATVRAEKVLCALGRVANLEDLQIHNAGLEPTPRGVMPVDEHCQTAVPHIYAAGDVIGYPSLASCSKEQGRRAICHAGGVAAPHPPDQIPVGIYTVPEMSGVGLTEAQAVERHGDVLVGRARFGDIARGQIGGNTSGFLKMVADRDGVLLGAHVFGDGATELIHLAQMAMHTGATIDVFTDTVFNFPTLGEVYPLAAMDIARQMRGAAAAV